MAVCVGIDVSKDTLEWTCGPEGKIHTSSNAPRAITALVRRILHLEPERVVVESTGGYERALVQRLAGAGLPVVVVNPWRIRRFAEGLGMLAKTDPIDARLLARFGELAKPMVRPVVQGADRLLADLVARRRQLVSMIVAEKNRLGTAPAAVRREIVRLVAILQRRVDRIDQRVDALLVQDPDRAELADLFQRVPGVGPAVTRTLLVDLPELGQLSRREIASLVGVAPFARDSGRKRGHRRIRGGRAAARTHLYLAAMVGARFNPVLRDLYERLRAAGKPPKLAFVAVARKLLTILNAIARDRSVWQA